MNRLSPMLFVGHGNPMHAITDNAFTDSLKALGQSLHQPHQVDFSHSPKSLDWAVEFDECVKERLIQRAHPALINDAIHRPSGRLSITTPDHWYPMLSILGAATKQDTLRFEYEGIEHSTISMRSFSLGIYP